MSDIKPIDFITQTNGANHVNLQFLKEKGIDLTPDEALIVGNLEYFEKGQQADKKGGGQAYLPSLGFALWEVAFGAAHMGAIAKADEAKRIFKKFYPEKYDLFF